jgi:hypothetical protein
LLNKKSPFSAYDLWKRNQLDEKYLRALFFSLSKVDPKEGKGQPLPVKFPFEELKYEEFFYDEHFNKELPIRKGAIGALLGRVMHHDPNFPVSNIDVLGLVDEISCNIKGTQDPDDPYIVSLPWIRLALIPSIS